MSGNKKPAAAVVVVPDDEGARELRAIVDFVPADRFLPGAESVLRDTSARIANQQSPHLDHLMLIVHVLHTGFGASAEDGAGDHGNG